MWGTFSLDGRSGGTIIVCTERFCSNFDHFVSRQIQQARILAVEMRGPKGRMTLINAHLVPGISTPDLRANLQFINSS